MRAILIPVKEFAAAKHRLSPHLPAQFRAGLAEAMCADLFGTLRQVRGADRVFVVSSEVRALDWARRNGWETIAEADQISESASVDAASARCEAMGVQALLRLPIDIPLVTAADIEAVLAAWPGTRAAVLVPSRDGTGTNALLRSPPTLFPSHFGPDSFVRHLSEAEAAGATVKTLRNPRIELDVDDAADLDMLRGTIAPHSSVGRLLSETGRVPSGG